MRIALVGVPNCGKTALFNRLTGSRQKVANYPGVTVERREGERAAARGRGLRVLDLPGTYSLIPPRSTRPSLATWCWAASRDAPAPGLLVCVVDAVHLPIGLRLALEVKRLGLPMMVALNRMDVGPPSRRADRCRNASNRARRAGDADGGGQAQAARTR